MACTPNQNRLQLLPLSLYCNISTGTTYRTVTMAKQTPPPGNKQIKTLERVFSKAGAGSRTDARSWIGAGRVRVNGKVVQNPDHWVDLENDRVTLDGKPLRAATKTYVLLYKPKGYLTTYRDPEGQAHPGRPVERALGQHPDRPRPGRRPRHAPAQARGRPGRGVPGTRRQPGRQPGHHDQGRPAEPGEAGGGPAAGGLPGRGRRGDEEAAANRLPRTAAGGPRPHRHVRRVRPHLRVDVPPGGPGHQPRRPDGGPLPI